MSQQLSDRALCITVTIGVINSAAQLIEKKWGHLSLIPAGYLVLKLGPSTYLLSCWYDGTPKVRLQSTPSSWLVRFFRSSKNPHVPNPQHLSH